MTVDRRSMEWHAKLQQGWIEHRVWVYAGGHEISTMIKRITVVPLTLTLGERTK